MKINPYADSAYDDLDIPTTETREGHDAAQSQAQAQADLAAANAAAEALLADLQAKDAVNTVADTVPKYKMPSPYAPGEEPNPVKGVAPSTVDGIGQLNDALGSTFKPVNLDDIAKPTNTASATINFAEKIKAAQKFYGNH